MVAKVAEFCPTLANTVQDEGAYNLMANEHSIEPRKKTQRRGLLSVLKYESETGA